MLPLYIRCYSLIITFISAIALSSVSMARDVSMTTSNWAPYYSETLEDSGFFTALVTSAFEAGGHKATIRFYPWKRAMRLVEDTHVDVLMGAYFSEERKHIYRYSNPIFTDKIVLLSNKELGIKSYSNLRDLIGLKIAVGRGWSYGEEFDNAEFLSKEDGSDQTINIRKLFHNRVDLFVGSEAVIMNEIKLHSDLMSDSFIVLNPPLRESDLFVIVSKKLRDGRSLIEDFNKGLAIIRNNGEYQAILKRFGQK